MSTRNANRLIKASITPTNLILLYFIFLQKFYETLLCDDQE